MTEAADQAIDALVYELEGCWRQREVMPKRVSEAGRQVEGLFEALLAEAFEP